VRPVAEICSHGARLKAESAQREQLAGATVGV
jgi:hypothetical protein